MQGKDDDELPKVGIVSVTDPDDRRRYAKAFGVTEVVLMKAIRLVGPSIIELRKLFRSGPGKKGGGERGH
jgi:hypothetical protein